MIADQSLRILVDGLQKFTSLEAIAFSFKGYSKTLLVLRDWLAVEGLPMKEFGF